MRVGQTFSILAALLWGAMPSAATAVEHASLDAACAAARQSDRLVLLYVSMEC